MGRHFLTKGRRISAAKHLLSDSSFVIVSNTTPLFAFAALGRFDLLEKVHGRIVVVETVVQECEVGGAIIVPDLRSFPWLQVIPAPNRADERFYMLDAGERDTLSVALEMGASRVLIDERLGRNLAEYYGLPVVGSLGTLLKAQQLGFRQLAKFLSYFVLGFCPQTELRSPTSDLFLSTAAERFF
jgi:predicted nucleic acid-binding protein